GPRLSNGYRGRIARFRSGPGVFKLDYALDGPVPWRARDCLRAGTVHLGGTLDEIAESEEDVARGRVPEHPFVLVGQQSLFDRSRAPAGKETLWAYCHVPNGSAVDMTGRIEARLERFAPGIGDRVPARRPALSPPEPLPPARRRRAARSRPFVRRWPSLRRTRCGDPDPGRRALEHDRQERRRARSPAEVSRTLGPHRRGASRPSRARRD